MYHHVIQHPGPPLGRWNELDLRFGMKEYIVRSVQKEHTKRGWVSGAHGARLLDISTRVLPPSSETLAMACIGQEVSTELELGHGCSVYG